jgi:uracil-DNA glycosylase
MVKQMDIGLSTNFSTNQVYNTNPIAKQWQELNALFASPLWEHIDKFIKNQRKTHTIFPPTPQLFRALELCTFANTKVVILGQDPYHNDNQANGLSFAVNSGEKIPPSLVNIFKEITSDIGASPSDTSLEYLAKQGVLLLNSTLTVEKNNPNSHAHIGWQEFTDEIMSTLNENKRHLVFLLWGANSIKKQQLIDNTKHLVLTAAHPSPLSAYRGFFGCKHFSQANHYLQSHNISPIQWSNNAV